MYTTFKIKKKSGGFRTIEAPDENTKKIQKDLLNYFYSKKEYRVSPFCHGGIKMRSIVTNAQNHVGKKFVAMCDIHNFYSSIKFNMFKKVCGDIFTEEDMNRIKENCFYKNRLPQGGVTSPYLSNIFLREFDWKMANFFSAEKINYSRYCDDITLSSNNPDITSSKLYIFMTRIINSYLKDINLRLNSKKTRILGRNRRQQVCGIVVNKKLNVNRKFKKNLRAAIFQAKNKDLSPELIGKKAFTDMVVKSNNKSRNTIDYLVDHYKNMLVKNRLLNNNDLITIASAKLKKIREDSNDGRD